MFGFGVLVNGKDGTMKEFEDWQHTALEQMPEEARQAVFAAQDDLHMAEWLLGVLDLQKDASTLLAYAQFIRDGRPNVVTSRDGWGSSDEKSGDS
jgi:hypothetical protein